MEASTLCETRSMELANISNFRKVGDVASQGLGESVSFGRFVADSSSTWRRRSSFHHNQYLEELGSFSSTGSVAQKKAYFEAYYKALAEKKASEREILIGSSIVSGLGTKKDPDIHLLKSSSTTIEGEKLGNTTSNMIDLEIRESQVDQHCIEDKDPIRSSNIDILTKKTEVSSLNLFKKSCGTDLPLDFSPKGQCSEIKSSIVIVLMKEKESQVVQEEHSEEIAMPMPCLEMSAIPEENLAISSGLEEEYYVATDSPCSIVEYENIFEKKRETCIAEISGDAEHQKEKEDEEFLDSPVGKEYTIENVNALSETLDAKRILDANDSNSLETRPDLSLPRFDTSSKPGKDSSIPSQEDEYTTEFSPSLRIEENVEVSGEINSMQNSVNKKHEQDKEENEFDSDSEALSTNSTHSTITLSEVLDEKNLNSKNPDVAEKFEGPQLKEIVNGQIMKATKTKDHVSRSVKYSQLFLSNKKPSLEEKIVKNKGITKDKNEERSVSTPWVGGSRSKFTVPQPFSLETEKRALALSLSQSVIPRPMSKTRQTSSCPSLQLLKQTQVPFKQENKSFDAKRFQRELPMKSDGYTSLFPSQKKQDRDEDRSFPALQELSPINESTRSPTKVQAFSLHTNVRAEKRKEFNARLQAKLNANDLEKCELQSKTKVNSKVEAKMNNTKGKENSHPSITKVNSKVEAKMNNTKGKENANPSFTKEKAETEVKKTKNPLSERVSLVPRVYHELAPSKRATKMEEAETEVKKTQNALSERVSILPRVNHEPSPSKRASKMMAIPHANSPKLVRKSREPCAGISGTLPKLKDDSSIHKLQNKANASGERNNNRSMQSKETSGKLMGLGERLSSGKLRVLETQTRNDNPSNIHPKGKEEIRESSHGNINHRKASKEVTKQFLDSGGNTKLVDASMKRPKTNIVKKEMTNKPFFPASFNFSKREVAMQPILLVHHPRSTRMHGLIPATQLVLAS